MAISIGTMPLMSASGAQLMASARAEIGEARAQALVNGAAAPVTAVEQTWTAIVHSVVALLNAYSATGTLQASSGAGALGTISTGQVGEDHVYEQRVLELVNIERARHGLVGLTYNGQLDAAAEYHDANQVRADRMSHDSIGDGDPGMRIRATGFSNAWGENLGVGQATPEQVVQEWMASPGHRANILRPEFRQLGVAYMVAANGRTYWAQSFGA